MALTFSAHSADAEPPLHQRQVAGRLWPMGAGFRTNLMAPFKARRAITFAVFALLPVFPVSVWADYGLTAVRMECDGTSGVFRFEPTIIWNDELDAFLTKNPKGVWSDGLRTVILVEKWHKRLDFTCHLRDRPIRAFVDNQRRLRIVDSGQIVLDKRIGSVWDFSGGEYWLRSTTTKAWSECCSGFHATPALCTAIRPAPATDCDVNGR